MTDGDRGHKEARVPLTLKPSALAMVPIILEDTVLATMYVLPAGTTTCHPVSEGNHPD